MESSAGGGSEAVNWELRDWSQSLLGWSTSEINEHVPALLTKTHWRAPRSQTVLCPHLLLGLHSWWGHGNIGVPATGKQHTQMGRECIIWDSCCFELSHYVARTAVSSITAQRSNWPYERNSAFRPDRVHQALTFLNAHNFPHSVRAWTKMNQSCIWKHVYAGSQITTEFAETNTLWWTGIWCLKLYQAVRAAGRGEGRE